jgi:hypothetical protein
MCHGVYALAQIHCRSVPCVGGEAWYVDSWFMRPLAHCPQVHRPDTGMRHGGLVLCVGENLQLECLSDFPRVEQEGGTYHGNCVLAVEQNLLLCMTFPRGGLA